MHKIVAAFDFDGTVTDRDMLIPFLGYTFGWTKTLLLLLTISPQFLLYLLGILSRQKMKEIGLKTFLKGMSQQELELHAKQFAEERLPKFLRAKALDKIQHHKNLGHETIIISANLAQIIIPWAKNFGMDHVIASLAAVDQDQKITGCLEGLNCYGQEKVNRLLQWSGPKDYILYFYGDSTGDKEILKLADFPYYRTFE